LIVASTLWAAGVMGRSMYQHACELSSSIRFFFKDEWNFYANLPHTPVKNTDAGHENKNIGSPVFMNITCQQANSTN
jgi:hypothetical protein